MDTHLVAASLYAALLRQARLAARPPLWVHGWKAFSQADEDGIIAEILRRIGLARGRFVEIGAGNGLENNSTHLLLSGWRGVWIEADTRLAALARAKFAPFIARGALVVIEQRADRDNAASLAAAAGGGAELLSVDIDGNDWHLIDRLLPLLRPLVLVAEYNARFGPQVDWVMPYDPHHVWSGTDWYGASLAALDRLAAGHGWRLVGCNVVGSNAFFVRADRLGGAFGTAFAAADHWEPPRHPLIAAFQMGHPPDMDCARRFAPPDRAGADTHIGSG